MAMTEEGVKGVDDIEKHKTKMCMYFQQGSCQKGAGCTFAHNVSELKGGAASAGAGGGKGMWMSPMWNMKGMWAKGMWGKGMWGGGGKGVYKTKMCTFFEEGNCPKGKACSYAHSDEEMKMGGKGVHSDKLNTKLCMYFEKGNCQKGDACTYAHGTPEMVPGKEPEDGEDPAAKFKTKTCSFFMQGFCPKGEACTYAHAASEMPEGGNTFGKDYNSYSDWDYWGYGYGKGKGKGGKGNAGNGHKLPRERITDGPVTGEVVEWKGKYGWLRPTVPIENELAAKHEGKIFVSMSDLVEVEELKQGSTCQFQVFSDSSGLGAEECKQL